MSKSVSWNILRKDNMEIKIFDITCQNWILLCKTIYEIQTCHQSSECRYFLTNLHSIILYWLSITFKDDFQSVLQTLEFVYVFCFVSCKASQNMNILQLLKWSKFKVSCQPPVWTQSFVLRSFLYHLMKQLCSCKSQWNCWKNKLKGLKREGMWLVRNNIDSHSIEWDFFCL